MDCYVDLYLHRQEMKMWTPLDCRCLAEWTHYRRLRILNILPLLWNYSMNNRLECLIQKENSKHFETNENFEKKEYVWNAPSKSTSITLPVQNGVDGLNIISMTSATIGSNSCRSTFTANAIAVNTNSRKKNYIKKNMVHSRWYFQNIKNIIKIIQIIFYPDEKL